MANCGSLLKSALVAAILFFVSGQTGETELKVKLVTRFFFHSLAHLLICSSSEVSQAAGVQESPSERQEASWTGEKLASCCKRVSTKQITEPILGYLVQKPNIPCVKAVIFQTESGLFCNKINPWALRKIQEFRRTKAQASASPSSVSLLSIITSTTSPPSSSSSPSSSTLPPSSSSSSSILHPSPSSSILPPSSSSSPPSSSTLFPSSSSSPSSSTPSDETISESDDE
uniref:Chemokine interleukin-8-like domain-containing protein n=1 Tax=Iconisemion striatum TaxID=60296 RepID=A0A1A7XNZ0_9TELE